MASVERLGLAARTMRLVQLVIIMMLLSGLLIDCARGSPVQSVKDQQPRDFESRGQPPRITQHPPSEVAYIVLKDTVRLQCRASGDPEPTFRWEKDGVDVNKTLMCNARVVVEDKSHTLYIDSPGGDCDGYYQCLATNIYGTAVSTKTKLQKAVSEAFMQQTDKNVTVIDVAVGQSLVLTCNPPESYPTPIVYWGETISTSKVQPIESNERIALDYHGNLYFSYVNASDERRGKKYVCVVHNERLRSSVQGDDKIIRPVKADPVPVAPRLLWHSAGPTDEVVGVQGQDVKMMCIFSGYPAPTVSFTRLDGPVTSRMRNTDESNGRELRITSVKSEDEGVYECSATNSATEKPTTQTFRLRVESAPQWSSGAAPQNQLIDEGEDAELSCDVTGSPTPHLEWTINGLPLIEEPRRTLVGSKLSFVNLTANDSQVIQCNATNKHGGLFHNIDLTIRFAPPAFRNRPVAMLKVLEGGEVRLSCEGAGAPRPLVTWYRTAGGELLGTSTTQAELHLERVTALDEGEYRCNLSNKYGFEDAATHIAVLQPISVSSSGSSEEVVMGVAGNNVTLTCDVSAQGHDDVKVTWWLEGLQLEHGQSYRIFKGDGGLYHMTIPHTVAEDSGMYSCRVISQQDRAQLNITVIIRDKPYPPNTAEFTDCSGDVTVLSWQPGADNNDAIVGYDVTVLTSLNELRNYSVEGDQQKLSIDLQPHRNYTFSVSARNSLGSSRPTVAQATASGASGCTSPPAPPSHNPRGVCTELGKSDELVVKWEPLAVTELNGPGFFYLVSYTRVRDVPDGVEEEEIRQVNHWSEGRAVVSGLEPFTLYRVQVLAVNDVGRSGAFIHSYNMRTGEAAALVSPQNFALDPDSLNSTSALVEWDPIDERDVSQIRGYFRGYQVTYWRADKPDDKRTTDLVLRPDPVLCPLTEVKAESIFRKRRDTRSSVIRGWRPNVKDVLSDSWSEEVWPRYRRDLSGDSDDSLTNQRVSLIITNLWSSSDVIAGVSVLNGAGAGQLSDTISFKTQPGPSEPVENLEVVDAGSFHIDITWQPPATRADDMDVITGYVITYRIILDDGELSNTEYIQVELPAHKESSRLIGLQPDTLYRINICAVAKYGCGKPNSVEQKTKPDAPPDKPVIHHIAAGETWANVSYGTESHNNPPTEYFIEFRKTDARTDTYMRTYREAERQWINLTELVPGFSYELRVVAVNLKYQTTSDTQPYTLPSTDPVMTQSAGSALWLIILLTIILLIVIIIIIACIVHRRRRGSYPVKEGEKLAKDDAPFCEYSAPSLPLTTSSQDSLDPAAATAAAARAADDSDMDSLLGEYEESEETKFNEDGSFIGQYGGPVRRLDSREPPYNTFV